MTDFFTGDWHLGHNNIIKYANRPFKDIDEHDSTIIYNVNSLVMPGDRLFNVGDVAFKGAVDQIEVYRRRFNCKNIFVTFGNHDLKNQKILSKFFTILPAEYMYESEGYSIVLSHYAMRVWNKSHHGVAQLYGHSHGKLPPIPGYKAFDVGVDSWDYKPISLAQVKAEMNRLCPSGVTTTGDHHGKK